MDLPSSIVSDPDVLGGLPRVRNTRISVRAVLETLGTEGDVPAVLDAYPSLTPDDVRDCLLFAAGLAGTPLASSPERIDRSALVLEGSVLPYRVVGSSLLGLSDDLTMDEPAPPPFLPREEEARTPDLGS
ncbi:DUF433 domain-containing protein [Deinococcus pimensis]|uniref:DUF433 domain-containing protein n=1 Tax=Deinococcus pimensis TaxID=309888 RepID=UPI0004B18668|nr:DUF433 domain-containing protein [Deinococcus pimensis]